MKELIFIRHAETDLAGTFCGHTDPPINAHGQAQVNDLILQLVSEPIDAIYSSDLRRAADTASAIAQAFGIPCSTMSTLREIYFGEWEGLTWAEIERRDANFARRWIDAYPNLAAPGGEQFAAFESRVLASIDLLLGLDKDDRVAVITHGGVMRIVLRNLLGYTEEQSWALTKDYCSFFMYAGAVARTGVSR